MKKNNAMFPSKVAPIGYVLILGSDRLDKMTELDEEGTPTYTVAALILHTIR